ncbi:MAG TPA: hypothetical protein VN612_11685 [Acidobacteriaceae bacterium]|nr:hypothetical protein [Acidobacteriaceae bacterium]
MLAGIALLLLGRAAYAQTPTSDADSDRDGLTDDLEQRLLVQFMPTFMIARHDCAKEPGQFVTGIREPTIEQEDGTIYGQVFPHKTGSGDGRTVEIHYYHLWRMDCGRRGHPLDTEHVSVLVRAAGVDTEAATWRAVYWYAAAHENTVCDVSQISRASTLDAINHGATVWISAGKHASYLNHELCQKGCGADRCEEMVPLKVSQIVNLGEPRHPMNGSAFISSTRWPLKEKMEVTNFPPPALTRLEELPDTDIAWFHSGRHPAQGVIAAGGSTQNGIARGGRDTDDALTSADGSTDVAISLAKKSTGNALSKSYRKTAHALGIASRRVGKAVGVASGAPK